MAAGPNGVTAIAGWKMVPQTGPPRWSGPDGGPVHRRRREMGQDIRRPRLRARRGLRPRRERLRRHDGEPRRRRRHRRHQVQRGRRLEVDADLRRRRPGLRADRRRPVRQRDRRRRQRRLRHPHGDRGVQVRHRREPGVAGAGTLRSAGRRSRRRRLLRRGPRPRFGGDIYVAGASDYRVSGVWIESALVVKFAAADGVRTAGGVYEPLHNASSWFDGLTLRGSPGRRRRDVGPRRRQARGRPGHEVRPRPADEVPQGVGRRQQDR